MRRVEMKFIVGVVTFGALAGCSSDGQAPTSTRSESRSVTAALQQASDDPEQLQLVAEDLQAPEQASDVIYSGAILDGVPIAQLTTGTPERFSVAQSEIQPAKSRAPDHISSSKVADELLQTIGAYRARGEASSLIPVLVHFKETIKLPRFPTFREDLPKDATENAEVLGRTQQIIDRIVAARRPSQEQRVTDLEGYGAKLKESFWLVDAQTVEIPADNIEALASRSDVISIDPVYSGSVGANQLVDSRALLSTDPYYNLSLTGGYIGSIDSGVRATHTLLSGRLSWVRDCVNGLTNNCGTGTGLNPTDEANHGTGVISILSGNANQGANNRGITGIYADSFRATDAAGAIYGDAFIRGYSAALAGGDKVITTSLQRWENEDSTIAAAADAAFDAGSVILALQGNQGPTAYQVRCPAIARRVIAVGAIDVTTQVIENYSSRGPANDNRIKPDLVAPTNVRAAGALSDTDYIAIFNGTSGATPHAAGAAALLRNWLVPAIPNIEPGQVYAHLIASGNRPNFDDTYGTGLLTLMTNTTWFSGKTSISGGVIDMPITISGTVSRIDVALWWPWTMTQHNDIDLDLVNPSGTVVASSTVGTNLFEKLRFTTTTTGTYKVRIRWYSGSGTQSAVYWAALQRY